MSEAIRFSQKLSGSLVIEITSTTTDVAVRERGALTVPAIEQSPDRFIIDDEYLADVQTFVASVKRPRRPQYVRIDDDGTMVPAPKASGDDEPKGMKP